MIIEKCQIDNFYFLKCSNLLEDKQVLNELSQYAFENGLVTQEHNLAIIERENKYLYALIM